MGVEKQQLQPKKGGERRVSEAIIHRPPLPPTISGRSQSLDGLLDESCVVDMNDDEGASDVVDGRNAIGLEARSLEVLLDENEDKEQQPPETVQRPPRREERSKSVDNYLGDQITDKKRFDSLPRTRSPSEKFCESETLVVDEARQVPGEKSKKTHDTAYNSEEEGPIVQMHEADSNSSSPSRAMSRQNSTTSSELPERKKTFINRLGKRVRSMIKK